MNFGQIKAKKSNYTDPHVKNLLSAALDWSVPAAPRPLQLRVSSLPFCGILALAEKLSPKPNYSSYVDQFYLNIGTLVHGLLQSILVNSPQGSQVYGRFQCNMCQKTTKPRFRPNKCPFCKQPTFWTYVELAFQRWSLGGHLDLLSQDDNKKWVAWEFKTSGLSAIKKGPQALPYPKHIRQIHSYSALLQEQLNIIVDRYVIVYFSRENPKSIYVCPPLKFTPEMRAQALTHFDDSQRAYSALKALLKLEATNKQAIADQVEIITAHRPCYSANDYKTTMEPTFFQESCPFFENGVCGKPKIEKLTQALTIKTQRFLKPAAEKTT